MEPRYNEGSRHWQNLFAISRFFFIILLYNTGVKKIVGYPRTSLYRDSLYRGSTVQICRTLRPRPLVRIWTNRNKLSVHTKSVNLFTETTSFRTSLQSGLRALSTRLRVKKIRGFKPFRFLWTKVNGICAAMFPVVTLNNMVNRAKKFGKHASFATRPWCSLGLHHKKQIP